MTAKRTPGPWSVYPEGEWPGIEAEDFTVILYGDEDDEAGVRGVTPEQAFENAEFIVRAVNCHDDLLAALRELHAHTSHHGTGAKGWNAALNKAEAAIAKAEGK